jgi:hypothetical protein
MTLTNHIHLDDIAKEYALDGSILFLLFSPHSYSFALMQEDKKQFFYAAHKVVETSSIEETYKQWKAFFSLNKTLQSAYKKQIILFDTACETLVPEELYQENDSREMLDFLHPLANDYTVLEQDLPEYKAKSLYAVPQNILEKLKSDFPQPEFFSASASFLQSTIHLYKDVLKGKRLFVSFNEKRMHLLCFEDDNLLLSNSYAFENEDAVCYQILDVMQQFGMDSMKDMLYLSGGIDEDSAVYKKTAKYVKNIHFMNRPDTVKYSAFFNEIPPQYYFLILSKSL